jgi:phage baseplate assembly protein W
MSHEFIGKGWSFPVRTDATGSIALSSRQTELEESMRLILGTAYGERPMRPEFGCGIHEYIFSSIDATTAGRIAYEVRIALTRWEPRIDIADVQAVSTDNKEGVVLIEIKYVERETNDPRNLVFPFYVLPAEDDRSAAGALPVTSTRS